MKSIPGEIRAVPLWTMLVLLICAASIFLFNPVFAGESSTAKTTLLKNQEYADALLKGIKEARKEILFTFYLFKMSDSRGNLPREIATELVKAKRRGIDVSVILEEGSNRNDPLNSENHTTAQFLSRNGIKVFFDSPRITTHAKVAVIDNRFVYLGSHNLTQSALRHNNELSVLIDSPEIAKEVKSWLDRL